MMEVTKKYVEKLFKRRVEILLDTHLYVNGMAGIIYNDEILNNLPDELFETVPELYRGMTFKTLIKDKYDIYKFIVRNVPVSFTSNIDIADNFTNLGSSGSYSNCIIKIKNTKVLSIRKLNEWAGRTYDDKEMIKNEEEYLCIQPNDYEIYKMKNQIALEDYNMNHNELDRFISDIWYEYYELTKGEIDRIYVLGKDKENIKIVCKDSSIILIEKDTLDHVYKVYNRNKKYKVIETYNSDIMLMQKVVEKDNGDKIINNYHIDGTCATSRKYNKDNKCEYLYTDHGQYIKILDYKSCKISIYDENKSFISHIDIPDICSQYSYDYKYNEIVNFDKSIEFALNQFHFKHEIRDIDYYHYY